MKNKKSNKNIYPYVVGVIPLSEIGKLPGTPIGLPAYIDYDTGPDMAAHVMFESLHNH